MVTPEDDLTAILRMTRGTVLTPCGAATPAGFGRAHLQVRAATFCTAHVLTGRNLWKIAVKYGRNNDQAAIILASFNVSKTNVCRNRYLEYVICRTNVYHKWSGSGRWYS